MTALGFAKPFVLRQLFSCRFMTESDGNQACELHCDEDLAMERA